VHRLMAALSRLLGTKPEPPHDAERAVIARRLRGQEARLTALRESYRAQDDRLARHQ
jgi:hypothetical protein